MSKMADLRIDQDEAHRLVAQILRERFNPAEANEFAKKICNGLHAAMNPSARPSLRGWRMIPPSLPHPMDKEFETDVQQVVVAERHHMARDLWDTAYKYGTDIPDDR